MKLPNSENAVVDLSKLRNYCLSEDHPIGRHKARVFASALGLMVEDADTLRELLLTAARNHDATPTILDNYGQRYLLDFPIEGPDGPVQVWSCWIVLKDESAPRLTTCYVL
jgi:hypothetical protein